MGVNVFLQSNLSQRIVTAVVGIATLLGLLFFLGTLGLYIITLVISAGMLWEFMDLFLSPEQKNEKVILYSGASLSYLLVLFYPDFIKASTLFGFSWILCGIIISQFIKNSSEEPTLVDFNKIGLMVVAWMYCVSLPQLWITLSQSALGLTAVAFMALVVWISDSAAYFTGGAFGRNKLFPGISPKKTVEGLLGGTFGAVLVMILIHPWVAIHESLWVTGIVAAVLSIVGALGDLAESYFKRACQKKDSSQLLPGHGGLLDRFDSMVFCVPFMCAIIWLIV